MNAARIARRTALSLLIGVALAWGMNELTYHYLKSDSTRPPKTVELVIPAGTAQRVERGEAEAGIPTGMVFVIGDRLVVRNQDSANHQLGPLFIPAGSSATMRFEAAEKYSYSCSFVPQKTFGLDVQLPVTWATRAIGAVLAGLPLGVLIALYSLVVGPPTRRAALA